MHMVYMEEQLYMRHGAQHWWIVFLVYLCHILVQGSTELPIIAEMLIHFRFGENGALICP